MERIEQSCSASESFRVQIPGIFSAQFSEPLLKRPLDIVLSTLMMILSLPVSMSIALVIKLEDRGSVFYRQERWSRGREDPYPFQSTDYADYTD
jgi:lipopolysaccharide/colanic/teichoic acid biosynthesis glycosyltransferase